MTSSETLVLNCDCQNFTLVNHETAACIDEFLIVANDDVYNDYCDINADESIASKDSRDIDSLTECDTNISIVSDRHSERMLIELDCLNCESPVGKL